MLRLALALALSVSATGAYAQSGCEDEKGVKSADSDTATEVTFQNQSDVTIKVYWLDYEGKRQYYADVKPGKSYTQDTYMTHPWVVTNVKGACVMMFRPLPGATVATIASISSE